LSSSCPNRETRGLPLREPLGQAAGLPAASAEHLDRAIGIDAIRAAAVGHVLLVAREAAQALLEAGCRSMNSAGESPGKEKWFFVH